MAKSSRSKSQRANRALKRERYAVKEQARLEKIVKLAKETSSQQTTKQIYVPPDSDSVSAKVVTDDDKMVVDEAESVDCTQEDDLSELPMGVGKKTEHGNYPKWMNRRAIKKAKLATKRKLAQKRKGKRAGAKPWKK